MNREQIKHIKNDHFKKLKKHISKVAADFDVEAIHQFRVEYKKLRAYLRMISYKQEKTGEIKVTNKFRNGYNIAGSIRDLQLQQIRIREATPPGSRNPMAYLNLLNKEIDKLKPELSEILLENPVGESKKKTDAALPSKFSLNRFRDFVQEKWAGIYAIILSRHFSDDNIHAIRKDLKDLFYNLKIYKGVEKDILAYSVWKGKDEQYYNELLDVLGNFQDKCIAIALLKSYWLKRLNTYNRELLGNIKKSWLKDKASMKKKVVQLLKTGIVPQQSPR